MKGLLEAFFAQATIITYRSVKNGIKRPTVSPLALPLPAEYTAAALIYAGLGLLPDALGPIPALLGWGLVVANLLKVFPTGTTPAVPPVTTTTVK